MADIENLRKTTILCDKCSGLFATTGTVSTRQTVEHSHVYEVQARSHADRAPDRLRCALCCQIWRAIAALGPGKYSPDDQVWLGFHERKYWPYPLGIELRGAVDNHSTTAKATALLHAREIPEPVSDALGIKHTARPIDPRYVMKGFYLKPDYWQDASFIQPVRDWIRECRDHHPDCGGSASPRLPAAVLDVTTVDIDALVRLHLSNPGERADYIALSYCWGGPQSLTTTRANWTAHCQKGIAVAALPATLADAVRVTVLLGLPYLWVDALCIVQDDADDKAREIAKMDSIYADATLVLLASMAAAVGDGFLGIELDRVAVVPVKVPEETGTNIRTETAYVAICFNPLTPPLDTRGWTLQERYLATRRLDFGSLTEGISLTCSSVPAYMRPRFVCNTWTFPFSSTGLPTQTQCTTTPEIVRWRALVLQYSARCLSVAQDRLPAIAGLVASQRDTFVPPDDVYLAGLWKSDIAEGLLWGIGFPAGQELPLDRYCEPGWSWTAILDHPGAPPVELVFKTMSSDTSVTTHDRAALVAYNISPSPPSSPSPYGYASGQITLRTKRAPRTAAFRMAARPQAVEDYCAYRLTEAQEDAVQLVWVTAGTGYDDSNGHRRFVSGLLVHPGDKESCTWQRLGVFRMWGVTDADMVVDWSRIGETDVTLV